jgi:hypothetical protein
MDHTKTTARLLLACAATLLLAGCGAESERFEDNRDDGVYLRVVDAEGNPVEGVRVHVISVPDADLDAATVPIDDGTCYGEEQ